MKPTLLFLILIYLVPDLAYAASEYGTFESFYKGSLHIGWTIAIAGAGAIIAGLFLFFFSGGTGSPFVLGIGTWIGGLMGYSGIVATNAGLALLGGGAIASGGFGIAGGAALLTTALTFGTGVVFDYASEKVINEITYNFPYEYSNLVEKSMQLPTLPLPVNTSGSDAYEDAMEILQSSPSWKKRFDDAIKILKNTKWDDLKNRIKIEPKFWKKEKKTDPCYVSTEEAMELLEDPDKELSKYADNDPELIKNALDKLKSDPDQESLNENEKVQNLSLLALLYFVSNDYVKAKEHAAAAMDHEKAGKIKRTLPAFIYATSSLYEENIDFPYINIYFKASILNEPDNPLIPLLFAIYLDRIFLRFDDDNLDEEALPEIFTTMQSPEIEKVRLTNYVILLSRYFILLKLDQQKISSLANTSNQTIKDSRKTLYVVNDSFDRYKTLLVDADEVMRHILMLDSDSEENRCRISGFYSLLMNYTRDMERLASLVGDLRIYQESKP